MRLLWLPEVLRNAGLQVHEVSGWRSRGSDSFGPVRGITCHATAGARGGRAEDEIRVLLNGSPTAPPPIAQLYLARNGDYHVVASGTCFHNLVGWGGPNEGLGNDNLIGIEAGNDNRGEPWPEAQLDAYHVGVAAICLKLDISASRVAGHYEHQPRDKSDPRGIDMGNFRADVARIMKGDTVDREDVDDIWTTDGIIPSPRYVSDGSRKRTEDEVNANPHFAPSSYMQKTYDNTALTRNDVRVGSAKTQALVEQAIAAGSGLTEAQISTAVEAGVRNVIDPDLLADLLAEKLGEDVNKELVAAAIRDLLALPVPPGS